VQNTQLIIETNNGRFPIFNILKIISRIVEIIIDIAVITGKDFLKNSTFSL
jgi:hypothetical protein